MRLLLLTIVVMLGGCSVSPFGLAPWVIVMPGARLNVVIGNKSEDNRVASESEAKEVVGPEIDPVKKEKKKGFVLPKMGK